jgi:hypothetical protein
MKWGKRKNRQDARQHPIRFVHGYPNCFLSFRFFLGHKGSRQHSAIGCIKVGRWPFSGGISLFACIGEPVKGGAKMFIYGYRFVNKTIVAGAKTNVLGISNLISWFTNSADEPKSVNSFVSSFQFQVRMTTGCDAI